MHRSAWTWICFVLAVVLVLASVWCGFVVLDTGLTVGDAIGSPPSLTPKGQQWLRQLNHRGNLAELGVVVSIGLASVCLGTGFRGKYKWPDVWAYFAALVICPVSAVAIGLGFFALMELFPSLGWIVQN